MVPHVISTLKELGRLSSWEGELIVQKKAIFTKKMMNAWFTKKVSEQLILKKLHVELLQLKMRATSKKTKEAVDKLMKVEVDHLRGILCKVLAVGRNFMTCNVSNWRGDAFPVVISAGARYVECHESNTTKNKSASARRHSSMQDMKKRKVC